MTIDFTTKGEKNISLIVAPNGGGKTEMLFSFWWTLYGFDFNDLRNKKDTPYSLNRNLYLDVVTRAKESAKCSVSIEFEADGIRYCMTRSETFSLKKSSTPIPESEVELYYFNNDGTATPRERDKEKVKKILSKIIPVNILHGIVFDGERMKELSSDDQNSKVAIEGIINHVTNKELFDLCREELSDIGQSNLRQLKSIARTARNNSLENILKDLETYESKLHNDKIILESKTERLETVKLELSKNSQELKQHDESRLLETKRQTLKKALETRNKELNAAIDDFYKSLYDGYLLISDKLFNDVQQSLERYDIPAGLTVEAVKNILKRPTCICGHSIESEQRKLLEALLTTLPPDNINSTIAEMVRQTQMYKETEENILDTSYSKIEELEQEIDNLKKDIADVSRDITENAPEKIKELEKKNRELVVEESKLEGDIEKKKVDIQEDSAKIEQLKKSKSSSSNLGKQYNLLDAKDKFITKCLDAIDAIKEENKRVSIANINDKIDNAFSILSEDYARGVRLFIGQYLPDYKYRLVSYYEDDYNRAYKAMLENGDIDNYKKKGLSDIQIKEYVLENSKSSNSTGQSKMNTLAFAKAILDYSREDRSADSTEISKDYPFLIDSPFTELDEKNMDQTALQLHKFAGQIILLISDVSYKRTKDSISPYVSSLTELVKNEGQSFSTKK